MLAVPGLPEDIARTVYVDPYTAQVRGSPDTWYGTPPLQTMLDALHRNLLLLGEPAGSTPSSPPAGRSLSARRPGPVDREAAPKRVLWIDAAAKQGEDLQVE